MNADITGKKKSQEENIKTNYVGNEQSVIITITKTKQKRSKETLTQDPYSYPSYSSTKL